jgi:hypothetical protein
MPGHLRSRLLKGGPGASDLPVLPRSRQISGLATYAYTIRRVVMKPL